MLLQEFMQLRDKAEVLRNAEYKVLSLKQLLETGKFHNHQFFDPPKTKPNQLESFFTAAPLFNDVDALILKPAIQKLVDHALNEVTDANKALIDAMEEFINVKNLPS